MKTTKRIFSILIVLCMLVGTIGVMPLSVFAADAATIAPNGEAVRYSESAAEVSFYPTSGDFTADWQYYYIVSQQDTEKTADDVKNGGTAHEFDENGGVATIDVAELAEGVKYIHIVLVQKNDTTQVSNVLKLTIPEYVPLTIVPSADGYELDNATTITVMVGTTVTFTTSESGCGMDYKEGSKVGPDLEFGGDEGYIRTATFSEIGTYTIEASINYKTAECTVIVVDELHQHSYSSEWTKDDVGHWHPCNCGDMTDYADHEYEGQDCEDGEKHRLLCRYCGFQYRTNNLTSVFDHEYDNDCDSSCNGCGYERTVAPHSGTSCDICGWTFAQSAPTNLRWDTSNGTVATWDAVDGATSYIVELWKKDIISLHLLSHVVSNTSFEFYLTTLSPGSYYFTVRAVTEDIKSNVTTSDDIIITSGGTPIVIGGVSVSVDSIDGTAYIVGREDIADGSISEVDLSGASGSTDLVIDQSKIDPTADKVTVKFDGTQAEMNNDAMQKILDNLGDGDNVKISVKNAGSEVLPDSLTEKGPYGGSEAAIDKSIFEATGIENIEDRLKTLGLINGNTDSSVTEDEFEYLYHYLTTDELTALKNELNESAHFEHHQNAVNWLTEMIERDAVKPLNMQELMNMANLTDEQFESLADMELNDPTIGQLRQAGFTLEQMKLLQSEAKKLSKGEASAETQAKYDALLAWLDDAIAQKELEKENATITSMTVYGLKEYADLTDKQMKILSDMGLQNLDNPSVGQIKKLDLTLEQMELLYAEIDRARSAEYNPEYQAEYDVLLKWLEKAIAEKEQENTDTPTYINVSGTNDGINPIFIGAVDVNIGAVKADGTTTPIAIKADRSDAVAWSTNIGSAALEEMLAMLGAATTEDVVSNIKAYKVLDNGTLEAKASKVTVNADGTLTLSAMSNGNSLYIFVLEPEKAPAEEEEAVPTETEPEVPPTTPEPEQTATVPVEQPGDDPDSTPSGWIIAIIAAAVAVIGGGAAWVICRKKRRTN